MPTTASGLWWEELGGPAEAPAVVLSAGLGGSPAFFAPQLPALTAGLRVIGYDHRGTGRSARSLTSPHSVEAMARDIVEVMDAAGAPRAHLIGHAAGGLAGLALALIAPEQLDRLVLVNAWAGSDPHIARCFATRLSLLDGSGSAAYVHAQPLFLYPADWISQNAARLAAEEPHHLAAFPGADIMRARIQALLDFDVSHRLGEIETSTLVIASADDMLVPAACSRVLAAGLPNAELAVLPWGGHAFTVTVPDEFNARVVRFLSGPERT